MARSVLMDVGDQMTELAPECMSLWCRQTVDALGQRGARRAVDDDRWARVARHGTLETHVELQQQALKRAAIDLR
jgi:hypothetical protein